MKKIIIKISSIFPFLLVVVVAILSQTIISYMSPVLTRGEGREGLIVKALSFGQSIVLPLRHGVEIPSKPPLFHWIGYFVSEFLGQVTPFSIRSASIIGTILLITGSYFFFKNKSEKNTASLTILVMISSLELIRYSTQARVDVIFSAMIALSTYSLFLFYHKLFSRVLTGLGIFIFLTCAVLAKGPFGIIIPGMIFSLYLLLLKRKPDFIEIFKIALPVLAAFLVSSIWYLLAYYEGGNEFLKVQLFKENVYRVLKHEGDDRGHEAPFYIAFVYLFSVVLPWSLFLPRIANGLKLLLREAKNEKLVLCLAWVIVFVLAELISVSKRSVYLLPCIPALSYIIVLSLLKSQISTEGNPWITRYERILSITLLSLLSLCGMLLLVFYLFRNNILNVVSAFIEIRNPDFTLIFSGIQPSDIGSEILLLILAVPSLFITFGLLNKNINRVILRFALVFIVLFYSTQILLVAKVQAQLSPQKFIFEVISKTNSKGAPVFQYKHDNYAAAFYLDRVAPVVGSFEEMTARLGSVSKSESEEIYILSNEQNLPRNLSKEMKVITSKDPVLKPKKKLSFLILEK